MIKTGKNFEEIVEMLTHFKMNIQTFSALGLGNINKHSENFIKRLLNITYDLELENLNKNKSNFPGLDLGDSSAETAYQITATKKIDKIEDTLSICLKYEHYKTFKNINVFILTSKQTSYNIKTITEPQFSFTTGNIYDIDDLIKAIEHLHPIKINAIYEYLKSELPLTIESIKENKSIATRELLNISDALTKTRMPTYLSWHSEVRLSSKDIIAPEIYSKLIKFLPKQISRNIYFPVLNEATRKSQSNKELYYCEEIIKTHSGNDFYGQALSIQQSSLTVEKNHYTDHDILWNLKHEMVMLLTKILFFSTIVKDKLSLEISVRVTTDSTVYFHPFESLITDKSFNTYVWDSPFSFVETIENVETSTLTEILQKITFGFISHQSSIFKDNPFLIIDEDQTKFVVENIKLDLGIS